MEERKQRVVIVPYPLQGHLTPMLQLAAVLHSRGFSITVAHTQFNSPNPSDHPDFTFLPVSDGLDQTWSRHPPESLLDLMVTINQNCKSTLHDCLSEMMEQVDPNNEKVACIIYDPLMYCIDDVANQLELPSIILRTSGATSLVAYKAIVRLEAEGYIPFQDSMKQELVPDLHPLRYKDLPISPFFALKVILEMVTTFTNPRSSSATIWNTTDYLEHSSLQKLHQQSNIPLFSIGPLHIIAQSSSTTSLLEHDTNCISWLDKQAPNSAIYVSLGSLASLDENSLTEMAWGLANSGQPFLWVVRPGSVRGSEWIESLPENFKEIVGERGCIAKWAPQNEVLGHDAVGAFWSHCGWNSTMESIYQTVPMMCWPCFGDQKVNARYVSHVWKVGIDLDELERGNVERGVRRLLVEKEGEEIRKRVIDLKEKVEVCVRKGGSSYNSLNDLVELILSF